MDVPPNPSPPATGATESHLTRRVVLSLLVLGGALGAVVATAGRPPGPKPVVALPYPSPTRPAKAHRQPTGPGITHVQDLPPGPHQLFYATGKVSFPAGVFPLGPGFEFPTSFPVYGELVQKATALLGSGIDQTILAVPAHTMSKSSAAMIPPQPPAADYAFNDSGTNPLQILRTDSADLSDLTVRGTPQRDLYNGIMLYQRRGARVTDVKVTGIPGGNSANPGETFSINNYRGTQLHLLRVELDGLDASGHRVGASGLGNNMGHDLTVEDSYSHDMRYGAGFTHYKMTGTITYRRCRSVSNVQPWNFERCGADGSTSILLEECEFGPSASPVHLTVDSDAEGGSCRVRIVDPVFAAIDGRFVVRIHSQYWGQPQVQKRGDITLIVNGVPRPDLLGIVS
jgi:hypothetical protein